jgi:hypothetical protein
MVTKPSRIPFSAAQRRILATLASAVGLRMLGVFLVLPVFTLYGLQFTKSRFLVGLAFGCYGLTMAILQIPLGRLSDRIGRRNVLVLGMSVFALGSFLCAIPGWFPKSLQIFELMLGRLVQGSGAIVSTAFAAVADHVEPDNRSFGMAVLGIPIGAAGVPVLVDRSAGTRDGVPAHTTHAGHKDAEPAARNFGGDSRPQALASPGAGWLPDQFLHVLFLLLFSPDCNRSAPVEANRVLHPPTPHAFRQWDHNFRTFLVC